MSNPAMAGGGGGPELASYGERFLAFLIDVGVLIGIGIVFGILSFVLGKVSGLLGGLVYLLYIVVEVGYFIYFWSMDNSITQNGQTIGKKVMNIKIVKEDGGPLTLVDAILRLVGYAVSGMILYLGYIWIFIDDRNQGWHDKIAKTLVVKA